MGGPRETTERTDEEVSLFRVGNRLDELQDGGHQQNICDALGVR